MHVIRLDTLALSTLRGYQFRRGPGNKRVLTRKIGNRLVQVMQFEILYADKQSQAKLLQG